ncbi:MFS transporter [Sciscionella sp. SE31]|uniref:bifunctional MFS transporter/dTMP kinase n=1 Tax=Sciscionella sediminilitoris TaxID=1445613 RepID=UPI00056BFEB6
MSVTAGQATSTTRRVRSVLAIKPFRRLLASSYLCSVGDWLGFLALSGLASQLLHGYFAQNFAFAGVVLTNLLPGLIFAPIGGVLADRFDRRTVMVVTDLVRCALFVSIPLVGTVWWLFGANFLVGCMSMLWVPAKDSSVPNLMRHRAQIETANQVGLVVTYGCAVLTGALLYAVLSGIYTSLRVGQSPMEISGLIVMISGCCYAVSAIIIRTRIPEISGRTGRRERTGDGEGFLRMLREGLRIAGATPLIRGLLLGMVGAFAAAGAVIGTARQYAQSLLSGESVLGVLFVTLFCGLATGMVLAPRIAHRMTHNRLFGVAIVVAGLALAASAISPHLVMSLITVYIVGAAAGIAFLTGITIIGAQVEDEVRGRVNSVYQSLMKVMLFGSTVASPILVGLTQQHRIELFGREMIMDGTRPVLGGAGLLAALFGVIAYRQMGDRSTESILANLVRMVRGRGARTSGLLLTVEGGGDALVTEQATRIAEWLRARGMTTVFVGDHEQRAGTIAETAQLRSAKARALLAAAVRAEAGEREIRPALQQGAAVVTVRFAETGERELDALTDWATERLRPDVTVLLDNATETGAENPWRVSTTVAELAAADPDRYVVVDAEQEPEALTAEITGRLEALLGTTEEDERGRSEGSDEPDRRLG